MYKLFFGVIEDEQHFITECPLYKNIRRDLFDKIINICPNFRNMDTPSKLFGYLQMRMNKL